MAESQLALSWDNFQQTMQTGIYHLLETGDLVDVTFCVEGKKLKAHKMILSVCSPFFKELFESNPCQHPIIFLNEVKYTVMKDLLAYMYKGEVLLNQDLLPAFVRLGESLQIRGLTNDESQAPSSTTFTDQQPLANQRVFADSFPLHTIPTTPKASSTPTIRRTMTTMVRPSALRRPAAAASQQVHPPVDGSTHPVPMKRPRLAGHKARYVLDNGKVPKVVKVEQEEVLSGNEGENDEDMTHLSTEDLHQHSYSFATTSKPANARPGRRKSSSTSSSVTPRAPPPPVSIDPMEMELAIIHQGQIHQTAAGDSADEESRVIIGTEGGEDIVLEQDIDGEGLEEVEEEEDAEQVIEHKMEMPVADEEQDGGLDDGNTNLGDEDSKLDADGGDISVVRTMRKQEMPRYIVDGFVFHVNIMKGNPPMTYLRCLEYKRLGCHARAVMPTNGSIQDIQLTQMHNHPPDFAAEEKIVFMRELKDFLLRHINLTTKEVYDLLQPIYPTAAQETPYEAIKNKMGRWKRSFILDTELDMRISGLEAPDPTKKRASKVEMIIPD